MYCNLGCLSRAATSRLDSPTGMTWSPRSCRRTINGARIGFQKKDGTLADLKAGMRVRVQLSEDKKVVVGVDEQRSQQGAQRRDCPKCKTCCGLELSREWCESFALYKGQLTCWCEIAQFVIGTQGGRSAESSKVKEKEWAETMDQAFALETETVREARTLETRYGRALAEHSAAAPLTVNPAAGGHTEWYRGAYPVLAALAQAQAAAGFTLHAPLRPWLRQRLAASGELLYAWTRLLDPLHLQARGPDARASPAQRRVADVLDAYRSEQLDLARWLPPDVLDWHAAASLCR